MTGDRGVDVVLEIDFSATQRLVQELAVAPHGTVVTYGSNSMDDVAIAFRDWLFQSITLRFFLVYDLLPNDRRFAVQRLGEVLAEGKLIHNVGPSFALEGIDKAHRAAGAGAPGSVMVQHPWARRSEARGGGK